MQPIVNKTNRTGFVVFLLFVGVIVFVWYWRTSIEEIPGDYHVKKGNYRLEDGQHEAAVEEFDQALRQNPRHTLAHLGLAIAHMQRERFDEALASFDRVIALDASLAVAYADRGILYDKMGQHALALNDYRKALELDPKLAKGPGWLWRFLHNVHDKPSTIAARMAYLEAELAKPPQERLLRVPELDQKQRMNKY